MAIPASVRPSLSNISKSQLWEEAQIIIVVAIFFSWLLYWAYTMGFLFRRCKGGYEKRKAKAFRSLLEMIYSGKIASRSSAYEYLASIEKATSEKYSREEMRIQLEEHGILLPR